MKKCILRIILILIFIVAIAYAGGPSGTGWDEQTSISQSPPINVEVYTDTGDGWSTVAIVGAAIGGGGLIISAIGLWVANRKKKD